MGELKRNFLNGGIKYKVDEYYLHANATDFRREHVNDIPEKKTDESKTPSAAQKRPRRKNKKNISKKKSKYESFLEASAKEKERKDSADSSSSSDQN